MEFGSLQFSWKSVTGHSIHNHFLRVYSSKECQIFVKMLSSLSWTIFSQCHISGADFTAAKGIASLSEDFSRRGQPLVFYNPRSSVVDVFRGAGLDSFRHVAGATDLDRLLNGMSFLVSLENNWCFVKWFQENSTIQVIQLLLLFLLVNNEKIKIISDGIMYVKLPRRLIKVYSF